MKPLAEEYPKNVRGGKETTANETLWKAKIGECKLCATVKSLFAPECVFEVIKSQPMPDWYRADKEYIRENSELRYSMGGDHR
jgi:hypothetical protein